VRRRVRDIEASTKPGRRTIVSHIDEDLELGGVLDLCRDRIQFILPADRTHEEFYVRCFGKSAFPISRVPPGPQSPRSNGIMRFRMLP
jgi:hypothetical protein